MAETFPKFIIEDGRLIMFYVSQHRQLATDKTKVNGGGWFHLIEDKNLYILYNCSSEFGFAKFKDVEKAVKDLKCDSPYFEGHYNKFNFAFYHGMLLGEAIKNHILIEK